MKIENADRRALCSAASILVTSEPFQEAAKHVELVLNKELLAGKTPESREQKFQEYHGLRRMIARLTTLNGEWQQHLEAEKQEPNG